MSDRPGDETGAAREQRGHDAHLQHAAGRPLAVAFGRNKRAKDWTPGTTNWDEVCSWLGSPRSGAKKDGPGFVLGELRPCSCGEPKADHAHRNNATLVSRSVLALDVDQLTPASKMRLLTELRAAAEAAAVYSTHSSTPSAPRLRLLLLLDRDVTPAEYHRLADVYMKHLGWGSFDLGSREPARFMYMPTRSADGGYFAEVFDGAPVDVDAALARWDPDSIARSHPSAKADPLAVAGLVGVFNREYTVEEAIEVFELPYVPVGDRYHYTESSHAEAGVVRLDDHLVYSHHTSDPAYGQACSAFDLVRLHRFGELDARSRTTDLSRLPSQRAMRELAAADPRVAQREASETFLTPAVETVELPDARSLAEAHAVFRRWFGSAYDLGALDAVLAAAAVERLDGDPLWLLVVAGPGNAKTETVQALRDAGAVIISTITSEGALLSATPKSDRALTATGGLLRQVQPRGLVVIKDFTSILSMSRDARAAVLGALREVYDGTWTRTVGTDGGRTLTWSGRIGLVGAVTTAWDQAHAVVAAMGDRFVLVRSDSRLDRIAAARQTLANTGREERMRTELAEAVAGVLAGLGDPPDELTDDEAVRLMDVANLVTLVRTAVELGLRGEVDQAHDPESPTRFARQLQQVFRGAVALGARRDDALALAVRCARDSVPPLRLRVLEYVAAHPGQTAADIYRGMDEPRTSVRRAVDMLHALGVLTVDRSTDVAEFDDSVHVAERGWRFAVAPELDPTVLELDGHLRDGCRSADEEDDLDDLI